MTGSIAAGLGLALGSAAALNWGYFIQHSAATALPPLSLRRPLRSLALLFRDARWVIGFFTGIGGFVLYVAALALAPLSIVQAASAGGIALLAALVGRLSRRELVGVGVAVAGLVLLGVSLIGTHSPTSHGAWKSVAIWMAVSVGVALLAAGPPRRRSQAARASASPRAFSTHRATSARRPRSPAEVDSHSCPPCSPATASPSSACSSASNAAGHSRRPGWRRFGRMRFRSLPGRSSSPRPFPAAFAAPPAWRRSPASSRAQLRLRARKHHPGRRSRRVFD
jgi:hypothetical protein